MAVNRTKFLSFRVGKSFTPIWQKPYLALPIQR